jgi:hypothetical protein
MSIHFHQKAIGALTIVLIASTCWSDDVHLNDGCEPVHSRIGVLADLPNLARVSVSPWADEEVMAATLAQDMVFSRKSNPTLISTEVFDEAAILADLRQAL